MQNPFIQKKTTILEIFNNDQDRVELYNKIVELLIEAGYFRARIQNLEPFDKILGGLAWTLTGCFYDIDIDFKDEMNLTEKIRVGEKIVAGLKTINCPYVISTHQIQGLDLQPIYETLHWLVKRLLETRDERNEMNKNFSVNYLDVNLPLKKSTISNNNNEEISAKYSFLRTNRKFRPKAKLNFPYNDELRVFFGMIEFELNKEISFQKQLIELLKRKKLVSNDKGDSKTPSQGSKLMPKAGVEPGKLTKDEMKALDEIVTANIEQVDEKANQKVSTSIIETIFSENMDAIANEIQNFENTKGDEGIDKIKLFVKEKERLEQNKVNIENQINNYNDELSGMKKANEEEIAEMDKMRNNIEQLKQTLKQNTENKRKIVEKVREEKLSEEKMKFLSEKNKEKEELKKAISKLKKDCIDEKKLYDAQLENYQKKADKLKNEENQQIFNDIDENYNSELEKNLETKKALFEQNKIINKLTRKIQLFPSKLEILQYQKRFQELYDQINKVSEKSRNILNEINSKNAVVELLGNKLTDFYGLRDMYKGLKKKTDKEDFKVTLTNAYNNLSGSIQQYNNKLKEYNQNIDESQNQLNDLQLYELNYMKLIKEYNKEYNKFNSRK